MALHTLFLIILQESKSIHMIFLPLEKTLTLQNVIILIELVFKKYQNTATTIYS